MSANRRDTDRSADDPFSALFEAWMSALGPPPRTGDGSWTTGRPEDLLRAWTTLFATAPWSGSPQQGSTGSSRPDQDPRARARGAQSDPFSPAWEQMFDLFASWAEMWVPLMGQEEYKRPPTRPPQRPDKFAVLAAQGYAIGLASYLRYLRRSADLWSQYCQTAAGQVDEVGRDSNSRGTQGRSVYDERVAQLRDAGERFVQEARAEARAVQQQLLELARKAANADDRHDEPRRYAKAKP